MKVTLAIDGRPTTVEVDLAKGSARVGDRSFPMKVVANAPQRVELEIAGEKVVVEGWFQGITAPTDPVVVNGERFRASAQVHDAPGPGPPSLVAPPIQPSAAPSASRPPSAQGSAVTPPMPGKVVELRVSNGDRVRTGQVLLVLEAMKMRNEVLSPSDGIVAELSVAAGSNVRAREPMLVIVPG